ncbi:4Fe-4S binding protein [Clostridium sp. 'deep sea']|uniref:4Fe-4S binding protein n=1 Tax=Clostridium sp. 'deep sea' TaxID=2779445 RepID=UPI001896A2DA|nr:4Fe-4S binding protein [Clostridium sp. 'deep sea']QOR35645.1 4Fe-4S binding protein [Clostridium sp. 'deep sea']
MIQVSWDYSKCVACGKCLKACFQYNSNVLCHFNTKLNNLNELYEWVCEMQGKQYNCDMPCKQICLNNAIL